MPDISEHKIFKAAVAANLRIRETSSGMAYIYLAGDAHLEACMTLDDKRIASIRWRHTYHEPQKITVKDALILIEDSKR